MLDDQHDNLEASVGSKCFASQTSSQACRVFCHSRYYLCSGSSVDQGNRRGKSSFTSVLVPSWSAWDLTLWIKSGSFSFSVGFCHGATCRLRSRVDFSVCVESPCATFVSSRPARLRHSEDVRLENPDVPKSRFSGRRVDISANPITCQNKSVVACRRRHMLG